MPLNFGSERAWLGVTSFSQFLPGYQKSTQTFLMSHMVYFKNMKRNLGYISCTRGPPQPKDYLRISYHVGWAVNVNVNVHADHLIS